MEQSNNTTNEINHNQRILSIQSHVVSGCMLLPFLKKLQSLLYYDVFFTLQLQNIPPSNFFYDYLLNY